MVKKILLVIILTGSFLFPKELIDGIAAVVSDKAILKSEVQQYALIQAQQMNVRNQRQFDRLVENSLEQLINNKLILKQAEIDTIEVMDRRVDKMLEQRINNLISQSGG